MVKVLQYPIIFHVHLSLFPLEFGGQEAYNGNSPLVNNPGEGLLMNMLLNAKAS